MNEKTAPGSSKTRSIYLVGTLLVCLLPFFSYVGRNLEYEYSLLSAWTALIILPLCGFLIAFMARGSRSIVDLKFPSIFLLFAPFVVILPGYLMLLTDFCLCSDNGFLFWMTINFLPIWYLAAAMSLAVLSLPFSIRLRFVFWAMLTALLVALPLWNLWSAPQKRITSMALGFLHGPIYDSFIAIDSGIILRRCAHLCFALGLFFSITLRSKRYQKTVVLLLIVIGIGLNLSAQKFGSVGSGKEKLDKLLPGTIAEQQFTLHFLPPKNSNKTPHSVLRIARDSAFHIEELSKILSQENLPHVHIYLYPNEIKKKLWFGGGATDVTDVVTPSIHITTSGIIHPTLRHELVHALASGIGFFGLGFHPNMAFTEGLAVALAPSERLLSLDEGAASLITSGKLSSIDHLFSPFFWKESGARSYTVAGSFIEFLIQQFGVVGVLAKYSGASWQDAYGKGLDELVTAWRAEVLSEFDEERFRLISEALYRYPGVFRAQCPHSKADLKRNPDKDFYVGLRQPFGWNYRKDYKTWYQKFGANKVATEQRNMIKKIRQLSRQHPPDVRQIHLIKDKLIKTLNHPAKVIEDLEVKIFLADIEAYLGSLEESQKHLKELRQFSSERFLSASLERQINARYFLHKRLASHHLKDWHAYLGRINKDLPKNPKDKEIWLVTYLRLLKLGKEYFKNKDPELVLKLQPDPELPESFAINWYRKFALSMAHLERYDLEEKAWQKAAALGSYSQKPVFSQYARKAAYYHSLGAL